MELAVAAMEGICRMEASVKGKTGTKEAAESEVEGICRMEATVMVTMGTREAAEAGAAKAMTFQGFPITDPQFDLKVFR